MPNEDHQKSKPISVPSEAERKRDFLEAFARLHDIRAARHEAGVFTRTLRQWRHDDSSFDQAFEDIKRARKGELAPLLSTKVEQPDQALAEKPVPDLTLEERRQIFLKEFAQVGALTLACDAAGVDLRTLNDWLQEDRTFREGFNEAKLRYRDRLQSLAMRQITEERDGPMLRFTLQAEFPEKYGKPGKFSKDRPGLTWADLERMAGEARRINDAAAAR